MNGNFNLSLIQIKMDNEGKTLLETMVLSQTQRLLSFEDRSVASPTYGCFDRDYWAWKFKDIQDACMQNGIYALTLLWKNDFDRNVYYRNDNVLEWIVAGLKRWCGIQHRNGSFDQIIPNEYSYGATAFTLLYILETLIALGDAIPSSLIDELIHDAADRAATFLMNSKEEHGIIANHRCGAAAAIFNYYLLSGEKKAKDKSEAILASVLEGRNEGWLCEYGAADPGYQTLAIYYLAKYYTKAKDTAILDKIKKLCEFVSYFVHPNYSFGGSYGSRTTELLYPGGFALLKNELPLADSLTKMFFKALTSQGQVTLRSMDDSNLIPLMISYLETLASEEASSTETIQNREVPALPIEQAPFKKHFKDGMLYVVNTDVYYAVLGIGSNGLLKVYDKNERKIVYDGYGYLAELEDGSFLSSQFHNSQVTVEIREEIVIVKGFLSKISSPVPTPWKILFLRILNLTVCKSKTLGNFIKRVLVRLLINQKPTRMILLERSITFSDDSILVTDRLSKSTPLKVKKLTRRLQHRTIHMATAAYFKESDLCVSEPFFGFDTTRFNGKCELTSSFNAYG